jgi:hypothetical protein
MSYYIICRHGNTDSKDNLLKKAYLKYAEKIVDYIYSKCMKYFKPPLFLTSEMDRCYESIKILVSIYNKKYNTNHKINKTNLLNRSGREEKSERKQQRIYDFMNYTQGYSGYVVVCVTHSSYIPRLCPSIAGITLEYFKKNHEVYLGEGALALIHKNKKIIKYNKTFE